MTTQAERTEQISDVVDALLRAIYMANKSGNIDISIAALGAVLGIVAAARDSKRQLGRDASDLVHVAQEIARGTIATQSLAAASLQEPTD